MDPDEKLTPWRERFAPFRLSRIGFGMLERFLVLGSTALAPSELRASSKLPASRRIPSWLKTLAEIS